MARPIVGGSPRYLSLSTVLLCVCLLFISSVHCNVDPIAAGKDLSPAELENLVANAQVDAAADASLKFGENAPLVSVVIPTHERTLFLQNALYLVSVQDYPNIEVVVVDDSALPSLETVPSNVKYVHLPEKKSIGEKRNIGASMATGEVIVHWDDDDYFRFNRISDQVRPILSGLTDMTVLEHNLYFFANSRQFYAIKRSSSWGPHFATFVYSRKIWDSGVRYPDASMAEDYAYAEEALNKGFAIEVMNNEDNKHVYVRHDNTWQFNLGDFNMHVTKVDRPDFFSEEEVEFYHDAALNSKPLEKPVNHFVSDRVKWNRAELHGSGYEPTYAAVNWNKGAYIVSWPVAGVVIAAIFGGLFAIWWNERKNARYATFGGEYNRVYLNGDENNSIKQSYDSFRSKEAGYGTDV